MLDQWCEIFIYLSFILIKNNDMKLLMKRAFTVVLAAVLLFGCGERQQQNRW